MSLAFDEFGRPYIIVREQDKKKRMTGTETIKRNLSYAGTIAETLKTSLGPKGMDKMIVSPDGDVLITNDGATIVEKMQIAHPVARLMVELSQSQDNQIGDGTTGIVVLTGELIKQAQRLLDKGLHPLKVASGFEKASDFVVHHLDKLKEDKGDPKREDLIKAAMTALSSKVVSSCKRHLAEVAVDAVLKVADLERKDVNFEMIKIVGKTGGAISDTELVEGIIIDKDFSHPQMTKVVENAKIAILTCPFEPPKPKTKYNLNITNAEDFKKLAAQEQEYFEKMVKTVKDSGAEVVMCQWGFDDEANHLLHSHGLNAVRWVSGTDIELLALATGARIVPRFENLTEDKLGFAGHIEEVSFGTTQCNMVVVKRPKKAESVTLLIRGGSATIVDETRRSLNDALCVIRNLIRDPSLIVGGGAVELNSSLALRKYADEIAGIEQYAIRGFADALEQVIVILAENTGIDAIQSLSEARSKQISEKTHVFGVNCDTASVENMQEYEVFETLASKKHQVQLGTQVIKMLLKIDDLIERGR